jgi:hypothetical protein
MAFEKPDFSDAEEGDEVYLRQMGGWLKGVVTKNNGRNIQVL